MGTATVQCERCDPLIELDRILSCLAMSLSADKWVLHLNLGVTFKKDVTEQNGAHSVDQEQGDKDADPCQMKTKIQDVCAGMRQSGGLLSV
jgi:hypothetical protein